MRRSSTNDAFSKVNIRKCKRLIVRKIDADWGACGPLGGVEKTRPQSVIGYLIQQK